MTNEEAIKAIKANYPSGGYERLCEALDMAIKSLGESKTMTHEEAVGFLQESGWLQDHDRQIYEQGKRDGIEERKTGRWIEIGYVENDNYNFMCSECRYTDTHTKAEKVNYCWHCGAKMEGAEE